MIMDYQFGEKIFFFHKDRQVEGEIVGKTIGKDGCVFHIKIPNSEPLKVYHNIEPFFIRKAQKITISK